MRKRSMKEDTKTQCNAGGGVCKGGWVRGNMEV